MLKMIKLKISVCGKMMYKREKKSPQKEDMIDEVALFELIG